MRPLCDPPYSVLKDELVDRTCYHTTLLRQFEETCRLISVPRKRLLHERMHRRVNGGADDVEMRGKRGTHVSRGRVAREERRVHLGEEPGLGMASPERLASGVVRVDDDGHATTNLSDGIGVPATHEPRADDCGARLGVPTHAAGLAPIRMAASSGGVVPSSLTRRPVAAAW
jgi:hypothetical protein